MNVLGKNDVMATIGVKDLDAASRFYAGSFGLERVSAEDSEAIVYGNGTATSWHCRANEN